MNISSKNKTNNTANRKQLNSMIQETIFILLWIQACSFVASETLRTTAHGN